MSHWRNSVSKDNPHLHWWDIEGKTPLTVTVDRHERRDPEPDHADEGDEDHPKSKPIRLWLWFKGGKKDLGMNVTNCTIMEAHHGGEPSNWHGKAVTLRIAVCRREKCIRLDAPAGMKFGRNIVRFRYTDKIAAAVPEQMA
jgi:hypothetical protein